MLRSASHCTDSLQALFTMPTSATASSPCTVLRTIAPRLRHAAVFTRFDALQPAELVQALNDHHPQLMRIHFDERAFGQFDLVLLESVRRHGACRSRAGVKAAQGRPRTCCSGGACSG